MSRYRPPRPAGTALITPEGEARMRAEFHELWHVRRPQVTQSVSEAAAQGDRSENAERVQEPHISYYWQYTISLIHHNISPPGVCTRASSPTSFFKSARAIGESIEM